MFQQPVTAQLVMPSRARARHITSAYLTIFVAALLGSMLLGGLSINRSGFWYDETASVAFITDSATWQHIFPEQMPAYYIVLRAWTDIVGLSEVAGRWLSLLLGLLTIAITYRLAARYMNRQVAIFAVLILGCSAFFVRYYREMRPYMLLALACTLAMWFLLDWVHHRKLVSGLLFVLASVVAMYTHYFAGLVIAVSFIYFVAISDVIRLRPVISLHLTRFVWNTAGLFVLIVLALMPYLPSYLSGLSFAAGRYSTIALTPAQALNSTAFTLTNDSLAIALILVILAILSRAKGAGLALLWAFFPIVTVMIVHTFIVQMYTNPRYVIFIWPAFAIVIAIGLNTLQRRASIVGVIVLVIIGVGQVYNNLPQTVPGTLNNPPWREMFSVVGARAQPKSQVFVNMINPVGFHNYSLPMAYYFRKFMPAGSTPPFELDLPPAPDSAAVQSHASDGSEIWWITTDGESDQYGKDALYALYQASYAKCFTKLYPENDSSLAYWGRVSRDSYEFANGLRVNHQSLNKLQPVYAPGRALDVALGMYTISALPIDYSVSVQVVDSSGKLVTQSDGAPANSRTSGWKTLDNYCDYRTLTLPITPGTYQVRIIIYDAIGGTRVKLADGITDIVNLFTVTVAA